MTGSVGQWLSSGFSLCLAGSMLLGGGCAGAALPLENSWAATSYPAPKWSQVGSLGQRVDTFCFDGGGLDTPALDTTVAGFAAARGLRPAAGGACDWVLEKPAQMPPLGPDATRAWDALAQTEERYAVETTAMGAGSAVRTELVADSARGLYYAVETALSLTRRVAGSTYALDASVVDGPGFPMRGVVEGFYGPPYTADQRAATMACMVALRQNTYLYGPKGDPYAHERWADPYPESMTAIGDAASYARAHGLVFIWAVSPGPLDGTNGPGSSIRYSSDVDFAKLTAKIESVRALGVDHFGLFIDDVTPSLLWPEDQAMFSSVADAHAYLADRLADYLASKDPSATLLMVGTAYTSQTPDWRAYNQALAHNLRPNVQVLWTGPTTYSATLAASDMAGIDQVLGRQVVIWDNYPQMVIPPTGRAADLPTAVAGILFNPVMNQWQRHPIEDFWKVLGPLGDYSWSPDHYDPQTSFARWQSLIGTAGDCARRLTSTTASD